MTLLSGVLPALDLAWLAWPPAVAASLVLAVYTLRRIALTAAALAGRDSEPARGAVPDVLVAVACRDEAPRLPALIAALDALDYPSDRLRVVLVDDASTDGSADVIGDAAAGRDGWTAIRSSDSGGKAAALNQATRAEPSGEIVMVYDADHVPHPDSLRIAAEAFGDPTVAAVTGRMQIVNGTASPCSWYAAVESMVHQLVTIRGKDVLDLAPTLLGSNSAYRRSALDAVGGFRDGVLLEDGDLTLAFYRAGHRTRFLPGSVSEHTAPVTVGGYLRQHVRWGRGFHDLTRRHLAPVLAARGLPARLRLELVLTCLGYLDRLALAAAVAVAALVPATRALLIPVAAISLATPLAQAVVALGLARARPAMWLRLPWILPMFVLDVVAAGWSTALTAVAAEHRWKATERA